MSLTVRQSASMRGLCVCICVKGMEIERPSEQETLKASCFYSQLKKMLSNFLGLRNDH